MKQIIILALLILSLTTLTSCGSPDVAGIVSSSDVDKRFADNAALPEKANVTIAGSDFSFVAVTDTHIYQRANANLALLRLKINSAEDKFILNCGDVSQNGSAEDFTAFGNEMTLSGLPYYTALGNHDLYFGGWNNYQQILGRSCYSFTAGQARIICIDSANGTLGASQKLWLENVLRTKTEPLCFVFTHFEFFSSGFPTVQQYTDIEEIYYLMHLFETHGVNYVLMGHSHHDYDRQVNGVTYINFADLVDDGATKSFLRVHVNGAAVDYQRVQL